MDVAIQENRLKKLFPLFFPFSFSLIPDELQAGQLIIDVFLAYSVEHEGNLKNFLSLKGEDSPGKGNEESFEAEENSKLADKIVMDFKLNIFRMIFHLAKKREGHFTFLAEVKKEWADFYTLPLLERAVLFLSYKSEFATNQICFILGLKKYECVNYLEISKEKLRKFSLENIS